MTENQEALREMALLEQIERDPDVTQATLATQLGVAVGTINWHIKRLIREGHIKIMRAERRKLRYIITPEGIALRARLTVDYVEQQFMLYRNTRRRAKEQLEKARLAGYSRVCLVGEGDVADVCRLTCLEEGIEVVRDGDAPLLEVSGLKVSLQMRGQP